MTVVSRASVFLIVLCSSQAHASGLGQYERFTVFPERLTLRQSIDLCESFGGTLAITQKASDYVELHSAMRRARQTRTWLRFTDEDDQDQWRDVLTGHTHNFSLIPWRLASEPTGREAENCTGLNADSETEHWAFDVDCDQKMTPTCQDLGGELRLRGMCEDSVVDSLYSLQTEVAGGRRLMRSSSGLWRIEWQRHSKLWSILSDEHEGLSPNNNDPVLILIFRSEFECVCVGLPPGHSPMADVGG